MKPDRLARIEALFHDALQMPEQERAAFLNRACKGDLSILREVESLIGRSGESFDLGVRNAIAEAAGSTLSLALNAGQTLGHYRVIEKLGAGGMGEVYAAEDTTLHRRVAVKVLSSALSSDPERRQRFEREAQIVAGLNHPNIVTIHSVEKFEEIHFLTMELVEGKPLTDLIPRDGLPLDRLLSIAIAIADAVCAAHARNIVHRDLKPANVMLTQDGHLKVLDFGLAKLKEPAAGAADLTTLPPEELTGKGWIVGTVAYMSPEQAEGRDVDHRSDIFSIGVLLFELATGKRPFNGTTSMSVLSSILKDEPPSLTDVKPGLPREFGRIVRRCLAKNPARRYQSTLDLRNELEEIKQELDSGELRADAESIPRRPRSRVLFAGSFAVVVALIAFGYFARQGAFNWTPARADLFELQNRLNVQPPPGVQIGLSGAESILAVSPDGEWVAFEGIQNGTTPGLYLRHITKELEARFIGPVAYNPFFSPDSRWLAFFQDGWIRKAPVAGGQPERICEVATLRGASWGDDGAIVFSAGAGLFRISPDGGKPQVLTTPPDSERHHWPRVLPGSRAAVFTLSKGGNDVWKRIAIVSFETGEVKATSLAGNSPRYLPAGQIVYTRLGTLYAAAFDLQRLEVTGEPRKVLEDIHFYNGGSGYHGFDVSDSGAFLYIPGSERLEDGELVWLDRQGRTTPAIEERRPYSALAISPDGRRAAVTVSLGFEDTDLWVYDIDRGGRTQLTRGLVTSNDVPHVWSADGKSIVFSAMPSGNYKLFRTPADGTGTPQAITSAVDWNYEYPYDISPDGRFLLFMRMHHPAVWDIMTLRLEARASPEPFVADPALQERHGSFSPDGRWVAYNSDETGTPSQIHVRPYPGPGTRTTVSKEGGVLPRWSRDGRELFYRRGEEIWTVPVTAGTTFRAGTPQFLVRPEFRTARDWSLQPSPDGQRFLMIRYPPRERKEPLLVYAHW